MQRVLDQAQHIYSFYESPWLCRWRLLPLCLNRHVWPPASIYCRSWSRIRSLTRILDTGHGNFETHFASDLAMQSSLLALSYSNNFLWNSSIFFLIVFWTIYILCRLIKFLRQHRRILKILIFFSLAEDISSCTGSNCFLLFDGVGVISL